MRRRCRGGVVRCFFWSVGAPYQDMYSLLYRGRTIAQHARDKGAGSFQERGSVSRYERGGYDVIGRSSRVK